MPVGGYWFGYLNHFWNALLQACVPTTTRLLGRSLLIDHRLVKHCLSLCSTCSASSRRRCFVSVSGHIPYTLDLALLLKRRADFAADVRRNIQRLPLDPQDVCLMCAIHIVSVSHTRTFDLHETLPRAAFDMRCCCCHFGITCCFIFDVRNVYTHILRVRFLVNL